MPQLTSCQTNLSRMAKTRQLLLLVFIFSTISGQINFGGGGSGSRKPSSSSGDLKPSSSSSSSGGASIQFENDQQSPKEVVQGLQSKRQTLATVLKSKGVSPAVDVNIRGSLGTRRLGDQCTTPQRTAGSCQYIFARQCRCGIVQCNPPLNCYHALKLLFMSHQNKEFPGTIRIYLKFSFQAGSDCNLNARSDAAVDLLPNPGATAHRSHNEHRSTLSTMSTEATMSRH